MVPNDVHFMFMNVTKILIKLLFLYKTLLCNDELPSTVEYNSRRDYF